MEPELTPPSTGLPEGYPPMLFSPWEMFSTNPTLWVATLLMAGSFVVCIVWSRRLAAGGHLGGRFPVLMLIALVPLCFGIAASFLAQSVIIQGLYPGIDSSWAIPIGVTMTRLWLGLGSSFSFLSIASLYFACYRRSTRIPNERIA